MVNYKIVMSYDGTRYKGWQRLGKGELTIQNTLETVIEELIHCHVEIHGSGRTDAGVHARGQVFHMKVPFRLSEDFLKKMNRALPEDIRIQKVERVQGNFHARYSAVGKKYGYYVECGEKPNIFHRKYRYHFPQQIDVKAMEQAAAYLIGTHDFSSFTDNKLTEKEAIRTIECIQIGERDGVLSFQYVGDGFLQHMVRILTGTLLEVGQGKKKPEEIPEILGKRERAAAGFMAPAKGLFLEEVYYK